MDVPKHLLLFRELEWLESKCYDLEIPRRYTEPHRKPLRVPEKARRLFNDWHRQNHIAHGALLSAVAARNGEICNPKEAAAFARAQQRGLPIPQEPGGADGADSDAEAEDGEEEAAEGGDDTVVDVDVDVGAPGGVHLVIQDKRRRDDFASTEVGEAPGGRVTQQAFDVVHAVPHEKDSGIGNAAMPGTRGDGRKEAQENTAPLIKGASLRIFLALIASSRELKVP